MLKSELPSGTFFLKWDEMAMDLLHDNMQSLLFTKTENGEITSRVRAPENRTPLSPEVLKTIDSKFNGAFLVSGRVYSFFDKFVITANEQVVELDDSNNVISTRPLKGTNLLCKGLYTVKTTTGEKFAPNGQKQKYSFNSYQIELCPLYSKDGGLYSNIVPLIIDHRSTSVKVIRMEDDPKNDKITSFLSKSTGLPTLEPKTPVIAIVKLDYAKKWIKDDKTKKFLQAVPLKIFVGETVENFDP